MTSVEQYFNTMLQQDLLEAVASRRVKALAREQKGIKAEIEAQPYQNRAVIHLTRGGTPSGVEFIETELSLNHPAADKEYLRFLRDDLYLGLVIPRLSFEHENNLLVRLDALREHVRNEGYVSTHRPAIYVYDPEGNVEKSTIKLLE
jgi:hypothetical protein